MRKLFSVGGLLVGAFIALAAVTSNVNTTANAAPRCTAESVGPRASAYTINGLNATVKFRVKGPQNCKVQLSNFSFYAPSINGRPYNQQILFQKVTKTFGPGVHTMTVKLPAKSTKAKGCFYQVDLDYGTKIKSPVLAYGHGKLNCDKKPQPKNIQVCDLNSKKIITIKESDFNRNKHTKDLSKCKEAPEKINICELSTKNIITIKEDEFDSAKHSTDLNDCEEVPVTPTEVTPEEPVVVTPEELPETGPVEAIMQMLGAGSIVASAGYYLQSRRSVN